MKQYSTYIFDLDGTLLNTLNDLAASCNYALRTMHMPERSIEEVRRFVGNGVRKLIERAVPEGTSAEMIDKTLAIFREYYLVHGQYATQPYDGVVEMLMTLRRQGKMIAVVSNKFDAATKQLCQSYFNDLVPVAIGEGNGVQKKPAPDAVNEALRQLGSNKDDAVYIGDSEVDILTAKNCGMPCVSVLWGFRDRAFLEENGASVFVGNPMELVDFE